MFQLYSALQVSSGLRLSLDQRMSNNVAKRSGEKGPFNQFVSNFSLPGLLRFFFDAPFLKAAFKALVFKSSTPRGLKNLGNTCYINSVIQCVSSCQDFLIYLQKFRRVDSNFASKLLKCFNGSNILFRVEKIDKYISQKCTKNGILALLPHGMCLRTSFSSIPDFLATINRSHECHKF